MPSKAIRKFWNEFCETRPDVAAEENYQVWFLGNSQTMSTELAALVITGKKTATASQASVNELLPDTAPTMGGYSVITDLVGSPKCVVQTLEIQHLPFEEVDKRFAYDEGEGDRTLGYWRNVHHEYFSREALEYGLDFTPQSMICCERFQLLYPR